MYCDDAVMIADNKKILDAATGLKKVELYKQLQETDSVLWSYNQWRGSGEHSHEWTDGRYKRQWRTQPRVGKMGDTKCRWKWRTMMLDCLRR